MDDDKDEIDPFSYQAPIPKPMRLALVMPTPVLLIALLINAAGGLELSQSTLQILLILLVASVGVGFAV